MAVQIIRHADDKEGGFEGHDVRSMSRFRFVGCDRLILVQEHLERGSFTNRQPPQSKHQRYCSLRDSRVRCDMEALSFSVYL
jgi:hypothetical protein